MADLCGSNQFSHVLGLFLNVQLNILLRRDVMYRTIVAFAFSISTFIATTAFAQQQEIPQDQRRFISTQACDDVVKMTAIVVNKYGEEPLFQANGLLFSAQDGRPYKSGMMYFVNQDTGTWSLISLYPDGTACMVANGRDFEPYTGPSPKIPVEPVKPKPEQEPRDPKL